MVIEFKLTGNQFIGGSEIEKGRMSSLVVGLEAIP